MNLDFDLVVNVIKWMAIMCRLTAFTFAMPLFVTTHVPTSFKMVFIAVVSLLLTPLAPSGWFGVTTVAQLDLLSLTVFMLSEAVIGLVVALVMMSALEIFNFGGHVIDQNVGFTMASIMDPNTNIEASIFGNLIMQLFIMIFLIFDGHIEIFRIAAASLKTLPPGTYLVNQAMVGGMIGLTARIFVSGMQLAMPIIAVNLFLNVAMGIMARVGEDFPVLMLSFAIRFALGFLILVSMVPVILALCRQVNQLMIDAVAGLAGI